MPDGAPSHEIDHSFSQKPQTSPDLAPDPSTLSSKKINRRHFIGLGIAAGATYATRNIPGALIPENIREEVTPDALDASKQLNIMYEDFPFMKYIIENFKNMKENFGYVFQRLNEEETAKFLPSYIRRVTEHILQDEQYDKLELISAQVGNSTLELQEKTAKLSSVVKIDVPAFGLADFSIKLSGDLDNGAVGGFLSATNIIIESSSNSVAAKLLQLDQIPEYLSPVLSNPSEYLNKSITDCFKTEGLNLVGTPMYLQEGNLVIRILVQKP